MLTHEDKELLAKKGISEEKLLNNWHVLRKDSPS